MLDVMRNTTKSIFAGGLVTAIVVALVVVFVVQFGRGSSGFRAPSEETWAARVNGKAITAADFRLAYQNAYREQAARRGGKYTAEQARADRLGAEAVRALVDQELIAQQAPSLGIAISDRALADELAKDPQFQQEGRFDWNLYKARVENGYQMSLQRFEDLARRRLLRARVAQALLSGDAVSDDEVRARFLATHESASIAYVKITPLMFREKAQVSEAEAASYAKTHAQEIAEAYKREEKTRFTQPAGVKVRAITIALAPTAKPEQEEAARARAEAAHAEVKAGKDFAAVAKQKTEDSTTRDSGGDLGFVARGASAYGKTLEEEALKLEPGQLSPVFKDRTGFHFLKAEEKRAASVRPLAEVETQIAQDLIRNQKSKELARTRAQEAVQQLRSGRDLKALFPAAKKTEPGQLDFTSFTTPQVQETEVFQPTGGYVPGIGLVPHLSAAVFALGEAGAVSSAPVEDGDAFYIFELKTRARANLAELDEAAKRKIREELEQRRQAGLYTTLLERLRSRSEIVENQRLMESDALSRGQSFHPDDDF